MIGCVTAEGIAANKGSGPLAAMSSHADYQGPLAPVHGATLRSDTGGAPLGSTRHDAGGVTAVVQRLDFRDAADAGRALERLGPCRPSGDPAALGPERVAPTGVGAAFRRSTPRADGYALYLTGPRGAH